MTAASSMAAVVARPFKSIKVQWEPEQGVLTVRMNIRPLQCYSLSAMREFKGLFKAVDDLPGQVKHFVLASAVPGVFNFGGDLALFVLLARAKDLESLRMYGQLCLDLVWWVETCAQRNIHTVALVQGDALGGGLESALPFQTIGDVARHGLELHVYCSRCFATRRLDLKVNTALHCRAIATTRFRCRR